MNNAHAQSHDVRTLISGRSRRLHAVARRLLHTEHDEYSGHYLRPPYGMGRGHYIFALWFLLLSSSSLFFSSPNLSRRILDVYTILLHMVWPYSANLECRSEICAARGSLEIQDAKKSSRIHYPGTIAQMCRAIFATVRINNRKKTCETPAPHVLAIW